MNNKTKKWLIVIGCLVLCAALVAGISHQFKSQKPADDLEAEAELPISSQSDVTVDTDIPTEKDEDLVVVPPDTTLPENTDNGAVSSGTAQTIQGDVSKPEYTEEQLRNPDQKPNGEKVTEDEVEPSENTPKTDNQPQGGDTKDGQIYVPGFGWITDNGGGGQGTTVDGDGDINKQVGSMG